MSSDERIDFGGGVTGYWLGWAPDRSIETNRVRYEGVADIEKCSLVLEHKHPDGVTPHEGCITIDSPAARAVFPNHPRWTMVSEEPLTLTPSVLCSCGWHGFITSGRWVGC